MKKQVKAAARGGVVAAIVGAASIVGATDASAAPSGCVEGIYGTSYISQCSAGGKYWSWAQCLGPNWTIYYVSDSPKSAPSLSIATCNVHVGDVIISGKMLWI